MLACGHVSVVPRPSGLAVFEKVPETAAATITIAIVPSFFARFTLLPPTKTSAQLCLS